mgnify:FL=1
MVTADALHKRATRVLPEVIQTSGVLLPHDGESGIAALLFPLRRKSSGSLAFRISTQSLAKLSIDPDGYLMQATHAREGMGRHAKPFAYRPWRKAALPPEWIGGDKQNSRIVNSSHIEAYFTTKTDGKALLVLIPEERLLVCVWHD